MPVEVDALCRESVEFYDCTATCVNLKGHFGNHHFRFDGDRALRDARAETAEAREELIAVTQVAARMHARFENLSRDHHLEANHIGAFLECRDAWCRRAIAAIADALSSSERGAWRLKFFGDQAEGFRVLAVAMSAGLDVTELRRVWPILDREPTGPWWELTFAPTREPDRGATC